MSGEYGSQHDPFGDDAGFATRVGVGAGRDAGSQSVSGGPQPWGPEAWSLGLVCAACVVMHGFTTTRGQRAYGGQDRHASSDAQHATFRRLRRRYNIVYGLGTFGDWIQGAYLYALYSEHGYDMAAIGYIFVLGYFASASVGTYVSSLGDRYGYRRFVILYGVTYGVACLLMRSSNLIFLLLSRVASGVAYSLLFSSFESWAITEADRLRLDRRYLVGLFSTATFFNACSAVAAGVVGNLVVDFSHPVRFGDDPGDLTPGTGTGGVVVPTEGADWDNAGVAKLTQDYEAAAAMGSAMGAAGAGSESTLLFPRNKYTPAFDVGAGVLFLCALAAYKLWWEGVASVVDVESRGGGDAIDGDKGIGETSSGERAGDGGQGEEGAAPERGILRAARMVLAKPELLSLGVTNSLYEAALHVFVFVWTPALERRGPKTQSLNGSTGIAGGVDDPMSGVSAVPHGLVFSLFMACKMAGSQLYMIIGDRVPAAAILRAVFLGSTVVFAAPLLIESYSFTLLCFCAFEFGLGLYWPAMAVMRAELVPNYLRATMTSVFRVPLNVLVMGCLAFAGNASEPSFLTMCVVMMGSCLWFTRGTRTGKGNGGMPPGSPRGIAL